MAYSIIIEPTALKMLKAISDRRIQGKIVERINGLANEPEKQGKELGGDLDGYRSVRAVSQRYRIIYCIDGEKVVVVVVAIGIRKEGDKKDVYKLAQRLVRLGLLAEAAPSPEAPPDETPADETPDESAPPDEPAPTNSK